jgi:anti-anti-sigma factor
VRNAQRRRNTIELAGEWDLSRKDELSRLLDSLEPNGRATIDLADVTYVDSTFLNLLARLHLRLAGTQITLWHPSEHLIRVLKLMKFERLFQIVMRD